MFKFRIIGFTLLLGVLAGMFFWEWGVWLFVAIAPAMAAMAIYECAIMLNKAGHCCLPATSALIFYFSAIALCLARIFERDTIAITYILPILSVFAGLALVRYREKVLQKLLNSAGILLLLAPGFLFFLDSYFVIQSNYTSGIWLLFLCLVTKATDSGGYIVGTLTAKLPGGNHKIAPNVSPKKSWEGLIGGMILSLAVSWGFYQSQQFSAPLWWFIFAGVVLSLGSFFGDLAESAIKRICNIKDSGNWVPGMGGAFDVLDSFIFNGTIFFLLLRMI